MRLTILGSGTSMGVPVIGCDCAVCTSDDVRNQRMRSSALVEVDGQVLLIDAGPDLRMQLLRAQLRHLDAVLLTHAHADHITGIDDLRPLNFAMKRSIPIYGEQVTLDAVRRQFAYAFEEGPSTRPQLELLPFDAPFTFGATAITPLRVFHGEQPITGFRIGGLAYITDASSIPEETFELLNDVDVLVLNALRFEPHPTHFNLEGALEQIARIRPGLALLTHIAHAFDHAAVNETLPPNVRLSYDGQVVAL